MLWLEIQFYFRIALLLLGYSLWQILSRNQQKLSLSIFKIFFTIWLAFIALNTANSSNIPSLLTLGGFPTVFICGGLSGTITEKISYSADPRASVGNDPHVLRLLRQK